MIGLLYKAASGLTAHQVKMDVTAHNIANVNSSSFKKNRASFADLLYQEAGGSSGIFVELGQPAGNRRLYIDMPDSGRGVRVIAVEKDFAQGMLDGTERPLDLAVDGNGFFRVVSPGGQIYYTRDGSFHIDEEGCLINSSGFRLSPGIELPQGFLHVNVSEDGLVMVTGEDGSVEEAGQIRLYAFTNPNSLSAQGNNLYLQAPDGERPRDGLPGDNGFGRIRQGYLEKSNVDLLREMSSLIEIQRAYQVSARSVKTAEEMWNIANNLYR